MAVELAKVKLNVPQWVKEVLSKFDDLVDPHTETEISSALRRASDDHQDMSVEDFKGYHAEWAAFLFDERPDENSVWATYFAPMMTGTNEDRSEFYSPNIKDLDCEAVTLWENRARSAKDPVMRARYADLVWDLKRPITSDRPSYEYAQMAVDAYVEAVEKQLYTMSIQGTQWLRRAFHISRTLKDQQRVAYVVDAIFKLYDRSAEAGHVGVWIFPFDLLYDAKGVLDDKQKERLIADLEVMLARTTKQESKDFNPHAAQAAAERLSRCYKAKDDWINAVRVIKAYGEAVEWMSKDASPMLAMAWLQPVIERYEAEGLREDAERLQLLHADKGKNIASDLKTYSTTVEISKKEIEEEIAKLLGSGELKTSLINIAANFVPKSDKARQFLEKLRTDAPLLSMFSVGILGKDGHTAATIGSLDQDPEGRLRRQLSQTIGFGQPYLVLTLERMRERYAPRVSDILAFLCESPLFASVDQDLLHSGLEAYEREDFVKALHVLVPQIEHILRNFIGMIGVPTLKTVRNHPGIMDAKSMNDILADDRMRDVLTEDLWRYLIVLYIDKRGFNLRNDLAHGLLSAKAFSRQMADLVFHSLLALSLIRANEEDTSPVENTSSDTNQGPP